MEKRKDALVFISPERSDVVGVADSNTQTTNVKNFFDLLPSTSFAVFDSGYKYQYDRFNDVYRYVPLNGDIAGVTAFTESVADAFFSPAGFTRGQIRGAVKLAYEPNKDQRDTLYKARINPVNSFPEKVLCYLVIRLLLQNQVRLTELMLEDYSLFLKRQSQLQLSSNYLSSMMNSQELSLKT